MNVRSLVWLEARNLDYRYLLLGLGILGVTYTGLPLDRLLGSGIEGSMQAFFVFYVGFTATYLFSFFLGLAPVIREKDADVYDRLAVATGPLWRVLAAKVATVAAVSFVCGYAVVGVFALRAGAPLWILAAIAPLLAVAAVGITGTMVAVVLYFDTPRLLFFGGIIVLGGLTQVPTVLVDYDVPIDLAVVATIAGTLGLVVLGLGALTRIPPERIVLQ